MSAALFMRAKDTVMDYISKKTVTRIALSVVCIITAILFAPVTGSTLEKTSIQLKWLHHFQFAGYYAALEKGFYKEAGLDVTIREGGPSVEVENEVTSGKADFGVGTSALLLHRAHGDDLVVLGQIFQHSAAVLLTPRKTGIRSISDMVGRKFMYSNQHGDIIALLKKNGIDEKNISRFPHEGNALDLISGKADVMVAYSINEPFVLERAGEPYLTFSPLASGYDFYGDNFFTTQKNIESKPDVIKAFRSATLRGWRYALNNKEEIVDLIHEKYSKEKSREWLLFEANQIETLIQPDLVELGYQSPDRWKRIAEIFSSLGMLPANYDPSPILYMPKQPASYRMIIVITLVFCSIIAGLTMLVITFRRLNRRLSAEVLERTQIETAMRESAVFYEQIVNSAQEGIIVYDKNLRYVLWNPYMEIISGYAASDVIGKKALEVFPFLEDVGVIDALEDVLSGKRIVPSEFPYFNPLSSKTVFCSDISSPLLSSDGDIIGVIGVVRDISERKAAEEALQYSENLLNVSQNVGRIGSFDYDILGDCWKNSATLDDIFGIDETFPRNLQSWESLVHPEHQEQMKDYFEHLVIQLKHPFDKEYPVIRKCDGEMRWVHGVGKLYFDASGNPVHMIGTIQDVSERRKMEEERVVLEHQIIRTQKLESLGVLAGGIAHDFNNVLTGILGNISFARSFIDESHRSAKILIEAEKAAERATGLTYQLLTFAKGSQPIKKVVAGQQLVETVATLVLSGSHVKSSFAIPQDLYAIEVDEGQISQAFHNIILNAVQAMQAGGLLHISAENTIVGSDNLMGLDPGEYVAFSFSDKGHGISEEDQEKIFDPYFTTKEGGNGLGLASVYSIVKKHNGYIGVKSILNVGTTFNIILPATLKKAEPVLSKEILPASGVESTTVLVMDDEAFIRDVASAMLGQLGYQVHTCINGEEAIRFYKDAMNSGRPYSAVIMDLTIPGGMGGKEAAPLILGIDPAARLIVSSGYSTDPVMAEYTSYGFSAVMAKPYSMALISQTLGKLFNS